MKKITFFAFIAVLLLTVEIFSGCSGNSKTGFKAMPLAIGKINNLHVIADKDLWESPVSDTFNYYFASAYPILPQPEPYFDITHITTNQLLTERYKTEFGILVFLADLSDEESPTSKLVIKDLGQEKYNSLKETKKISTTIGHEKWAKNQILVYMVGFSKEDLIKNIQQNFTSIEEKIKKGIIPRIDAETYAGRHNVELEEDIKAHLNVKIRIPVGFVKAIKADNFIWIRKDTPLAINNILLYRFKYKDKSVFTKEKIKGIRDFLGRNYISTPRDNTYMRTNDVDLPMFVNTTEINGNYALRAVGVWDIVNDFMGGPFVSYMILNAKDNEVIFVDGFIHAPSKDKRDLIQRLEYVLTTIEF